MNGCKNCKHYRRSSAWGEWKATCANEKNGYAGVICSGTSFFHDDDHLNYYCACLYNRGYEPKEIAREALEGKK